MQDNRISPVTFYTMGIAALFFAGFFLLVIFGAQIYRSTVAVQNANNNTRALLSYFSVFLRTNDVVDSFSIEEDESGTVLVIADGDSGWGTRIYQQDGNLVEGYGALTDALSSVQTQIIGTTAVFEIDELDAQTITITTDAGTVLLHLRSGKCGTI